MPDDPKLLSSILIALNATRQLPREAICKLGSEVELWLEPGVPTLLAASKVGVAPRHLDTACRLLPEAAALAESERAAAKREQATVITRLDRDYPAALLQLELPPPVLYCRGSIPARPGVAVVGPRKPDRYGLEAAELFAEGLAKAGLAVVSGFARGIDIAAHRAAMGPSGGQTVAVLGSGLGVDYPAHAAEIPRLAENGAVLSEFPCGRRPRSWHFPVRNRIIAGLAAATLVIQASRRSGALITARYALELGREVYVVPGSIFSPKSQGSNALLRDGAHPVQEPGELTETLPTTVRDSLRVVPPSPPKSPLAAVPAGGLGEVLTLLGKTTQRHPEELAPLLGQPLERVLAALVELELAGHAKRHPGGAYSAVCR